MGEGQRLFQTCELQTSIPELQIRRPRCEEMRWKNDSPEKAIVKGRKEESEMGGKEWLRDGQACLGEK